MTRQPLPGRRESRSATVMWKDCDTFYEFETTVGFNAQGKVRELFANSAKIRNQFKAQVDDALVIMSRLLQFGDGISKIADSLGRDGLDSESPATSIFALWRERRFGLRPKKAQLSVLPRWPLRHLHPNYRSWRPGRRRLLDDLSKTCPP